MQLLAFCAFNGLQDPFYRWGTGLSLPGSTYRDALMVC